MKTFSQNVKNALAQPVVETFYLVDIHAQNWMQSLERDSDGVYRTTSYFLDLTMPNGKAYLNDGNLVFVEPPRMSTTVDSEKYKLTIGDPAFEMGAAVDQGFLGVLITVRIGFVNVETGQPYLNEGDLPVVYRGRIESGSYEIKTEDSGETLFTVTCSSPMGDLDFTRAMYASRNELQQIAPGDKSFDQIYEGSGQIQLKWGKG